MTRRRRARPLPPPPPARHLLADRTEVPIEHVIAAAEADATRRHPEQGA